MGSTSQGRRESYIQPFVCDNNLELSEYLTPACHYYRESQMGPQSCRAGFLGPQKGQHVRKDLNSCSSATSTPSDNMSKLLNLENSPWSLSFHF